MAEFCLKCFNELNETQFTDSEVWLEDDFCENCGEWKECIVSLKPKPLIWKIIDLFRRNKKGAV